MKQQLPSNKDVSFGIRVRMAELGMTQDNLAERTGFSKNMISKMCKGNHDFSLAEVATLEDVLDIVLMLVPSAVRVITITMNIDNYRHQATVETKITQDGKPMSEKDLDAKKLASTVSALISQAKKLQEYAVYKMIEEEKK